MTIPFPALSKIALHAVGIENISAVNLSPDISAVRTDLEFNLAKIAEVTLVKFENSSIVVMNASDDQLNRLLSQKQERGPQEGPMVPVGETSSANFASKSHLETGFRLAYHIVIDNRANLKPGANVQLSQDVHISGHWPLSKVSTVQFRYDQERELTVKFESERPVAISTLMNSTDLMCFDNGIAVVSEHTSLEATLVKAGESLFIDGDQPVGLTLHRNCVRTLWHFVRHHLDQRPKHYFLLFSV